MNHQVNAGVITPQINHSNQFDRIVNISEKISWRLDEVLPRSAEFDFSKPLLSDVFFPLAQFDYLSSDAKLRFNHILSYSYLNVFELCEEFIIGLALDLTKDQFHENRDALRALSRFADEEVKHQEMFRRARQKIQQQFPARLSVLDNHFEIADFVLGHSKLSTLLLTIHLELITQAHYIDGIKQRNELDPLFCSILKNHWVEESQHVKIDVIEFNRLAQGLTTEDFDEVYREYNAMILGFVDALHAQAQMCVADICKFEARNLSRKKQVTLVEFVANCFCTGLLKYGFEHTQFKRITADIYPDFQLRFAQTSQEIDNTLASLVAQGE